MPDIRPYRILHLDVENSANISYTWAPGKYDKNIIAFKEEWHLMAFSYWWDGEPESKAKSLILPDYALYKKEPKNDLELTKDLWRLLNEADLVVTHNGLSTDLPKINTRIALYGLTPPSPYKTVDTLKIARKHFYFNGNSLADLAEYLKVPHRKMDHKEGFKLWLRCEDGDMEAWEIMRKYSRLDSIVLKEIWDRLKVWHPTHPNISIAAGKDYLCPTCGSDKVEHRGLLYLQSFMAQRYRCKNCGRWSSGARHKIKSQLLKSA